MKCIFDLFNSEDGQGMAEYAVILTLVACAVVVAIFLLGTAVTAMYDGINSDMANAPK